MLKEPFGGQLFHMFMTMSHNLRMRYSRAFHLPILNEVYYQCTRVVYERDPDAKVREYAADIKANVGGLQTTTRMVMTLMMYLLMAQSNRSLEVGTFLGRLKLYYKSPQQYYLALQEEEAYAEAFISTNNDEGFFLTPEPCNAEELEGMVIDWQEVTRGYSKQMIKEVLMLWHGLYEQKKVLAMIEESFQKRDLSLFKDEPEDVADDEFFRLYRDELGADEEDEGPVCEWCGEPLEDSEAYIEMEEKLNRQEKRNSELETENISLRSELNNYRKVAEQERAFTLSMIVDDCKNRAELRQVEEIIKMLNVFLRKDGKDEEYDLVDSIEDHFAQKAAAMVFMDNHGTVNNNR